MENLVVGEYRSQDPPKNFCVRVKLKRLTSGNIVPAVQQRSIPSVLRNGTPDPGGDAIEMRQRNNDEDEEEELIVHWQEKKFSEREYNFYENSLNCLSALDEKYHNDVKKLSSQGGRRNKRLFTYVDADRHSYSLIDERNAVTLSANEQPGYLVDKLLRMRLTNLHRRRNIGSGSGSGKIINEKPSKTFQDAHVVTTPSKVMKIMADLSANDRIGNVEDEHILCLIRIDANGQITVKPDFTKDRNPPRIETFSGEKAVFEYKIENISKQMTTEEQEQESKLLNELYSKHAEMISAQTGTTFYPTPSYGDLYVHIFGEIVCGKDFTYDDLYIQYLLDLPSGWVNSGSSLYGTTNRCTPNKDGYVHFSQPIDFHLKYKTEEDSEDTFLSWPALLFEITSLDVWQRHRTEGYTYCDVPDSAGSQMQTLHSWRPVGNSVVSEMRRFFTGGAPELEDIGYLKIPVGYEGGVLSKAFFHTEASGSITIRLHTVLHYLDDGVLGSATPTIKKTKRKKFGGLSAFDTLTHALDAFHRARRKMHAAKSTLPSIT